MTWPFKVLQRAAIQVQSAGKSVKSPVAICLWLYFQKIESFCLYFLKNKGQPIRRDQFYFTWAGQTFRFACPSYGLPSGDTDDETDATARNQQRST